jgi:hypothetical protein
MVYPAFGVVFAKDVDGFSQLEKSERRRDGQGRSLVCLFSATGMIELNLPLGDLGYSYHYLFDNRYRISELFV